MGDRQMLPKHTNSTDLSGSILGPVDLRTDLRTNEATFEFQFRRFNSLFFDNIVTHIYILYSSQP